MGSKKKLSSADLKSLIVGKVVKKSAPTAEEIDKKEALRLKRKKQREKKIASKFSRDKNYKKYDSVEAPEDVKDYLKYLYRKRKKAAGRKKFKIPSLDDAKQYSVITSNRKDPKYQIYWNIPIFITSLSPINHKIIGFSSRVMYKGPNLALAIKAANDLNRKIDDARDKLRALSDSGTKDSDKILFIPTVTYKRRSFRKKNKPFLVEVDYSKAEGDKNLEKMFKLNKKTKKNERIN